MAISKKVKRLIELSNEVDKELIYLEGYLDGLEAIRL